MIFGMDLGPHWAFIVTAWGAGLLGVLALIIWVLADRRRQLKALADLERRGHRRRSQQS